MAKSEEETIKYLTTEETERFFSKISSKRDRALFTMMYCYGLRCEEASDMKVEDLRLNDSRVYIRAKKNGISGEYFLDNVTKRAINNYFPERNKKKNLFSDVLFLSKKGGKLSTTQIRRLYVQYAIKAKLQEEKQHPHALRHSIAVHMADSGVPVEHVQIHLRHRKIESTMVYFRITNKKRHELQEQALKGMHIAKI